jgi:hypothetical protein
VAPVSRAGRPVIAATSPSPWRARTHGGLRTAQPAAWAGRQSIARRGRARRGAQIAMPVRGARSAQHLKGEGLTRSEVDDRLKDDTEFATGKNPGCWPRRLRCSTRSSGSRCAWCSAGIAIADASWAWLGPKRERCLSYRDSVAVSTHEAGEDCLSQCCWRVPQPAEGLGRRRRLPQAFRR